MWWQGTSEKQHNSESEPCQIAIPELQIPEGKHVLSHISSRADDRHDIGHALSQKSIVTI